MSFKGRHSASRRTINISSREQRGSFEVVRNPTSQSKTRFIPRDFQYHSVAGYIHPRQIIFDTGHPLPGIRNLGAMVYSGTDLPLQEIRESLTIQCLVLALNDFLKSRQKDHLKPLTINDLTRVQICKYNPCFWLIEFRATGADFHSFVLESITVADEGDGGNQGSSDEGVGVVNTLMYSDLAVDLAGLSLNGKKVGAGYAMKVAVVDRGDFNNPATLGAGQATHARVLEQIISEPNYVVPVACPMVQSYDQPATVFDMICALSNRSVLDTVQVVNISQGFYAKDPHPVLHKVLKSLDKPIVCSAGNDGLNNDLQPHWPSNFYSEVDTLISVAGLDQAGNLSTPGVGFESNFGEDNVTLAARGQWGTIYGTSYAAAWMSRMIALAFSLESRVDLNLDYIQQAITPHYPVTTNNNDPTHTKLRFMA